MISRGLVAFVLLVSSGLVVRAETVEVRSGEHPGFTRLVIEFDRRRAWQLEPAPGGYLLTTGVPTLDYDLSGVFDRIPRTRLEDVRPGPRSGSLLLALNCDCRVRPFEIRAAALVIDIQDRAGNARNRTDRAAGLPGVSDADVIAVLANGPVQLLQGAHADDAPPDDMTPSGQPAPERRPLPTLDLPLIPSGSEAFGPGEEEDLTRSLARELARAASQGLVETGDLEPPAPARTEPVPEGGVGNVRIDTALDRALGPASRDEQPEILSGPCLPVASLDVAAWGDGRDPGRQIAEARAGVFGALDTPDPDAVARLVRLYIHLSFGAEAMLALDQMGKAVVDGPLLHELAGLADGDAPKAGIIASQISCAGPAALWAALALTELPRDEVVDTDAILLAFMRLPGHLRRHLGPRLAARFAEAGDASAVETITNAIDRVARADDPAYVMARARASVPDPEIGSDLLRIARGVHPDAAEALLLYADGLVRDRTEVPPDLIDTADILSFERAGTPTGASLKALEIRARIGNGAYRDGLHALSRAIAEDQLPEALKGETRQTALERLVREADDATFLKRVLDPETRAIAQGAGRGVRLEIAERLVALGFPDEAEGMAEILPDATDPSELLYAARVSTARGDWLRAARFARRAAGEDADRLVAESLASARRHAEAADRFSALGDEQRSKAEIWRAGDWERIAESGDPIRSGAVRALLALQEPPTPRDTPTLAAARDEAMAAATLRESIEVLMEAVPPPDAPEARQ